MLWVRGVRAGPAVCLSWQLTIGWTIRVGRLSRRMVQLASLRRVHRQDPFRGKVWIDRSRIMWQDRTGLDRISLG